MKSLVFDFEKASTKDSAVKAAVRLFLRAGAQVVSSSVDQAISRKAGVTYRNVNFTFADGQTVTLGVKSTGDVFEVKINGKPTPLRNQDDHALAIAEIATKMDVGRSKFQKILALVKIPLPPSIRTSRANMIIALTAKRDNLKAAVEVATAELARLTPAS
nr:hypothetical protein [uncultured Rhodoferax sp.]